MEVFLSKKLQKCLDNAKKMFGPKKADKILMRINELSAASTLFDIKQIPQTGLHLLSGNMKDKFAISTVQPFRIIIEPFDYVDISDLKTIQKVKIINLDIDYH
jgi:hypothetical protein